MFDKRLFRIFYLSLLMYHGSLLHVGEIHKMIKKRITPRQMQCIYSGIKAPMKSKPSMLARDVGPFIP